MADGDGFGGQLAVAERLENVRLDRGQSCSGAAAHPGDLGIVAMGAERQRGEVEHVLGDAVRDRRIGHRGVGDDVHVAVQKMQCGVGARDGAAERLRIVRGAARDPRQWQQQGDEAALRQHGAGRGIERGNHAGAADARDQLLAELGGAGAAGA